jgi:hypothetical protein
MMLWTGKRSLVILSLVLPVLIVPLISVLIFPEVSITTALLGGVFLSLLAVLGLRLIQSAKAFGARFIVAVIVIAVLAGLLMGILPQLF